MSVRRFWVGMIVLALSTVLLAPVSAWAAVPDQAAGGPVSLWQAFVEFCGAWLPGWSDGEAKSDLQTLETASNEPDSDDEEESTEEALTSPPELSGLSGSDGSDSEGGGRIDPGG